MERSCRCVRSRSGRRDPMGRGHRAAAARAARRPDARGGRRRDDSRRLRLVYPVLKAMEEHGRMRRGYFVAGLGATQFALPGALDLLRSLRDAPMTNPEIVGAAATDPANPYGATLKVPSSGSERAARGFTRTVGATRDPRRRRARRISRARRPPAADVAARGGAATIASRPRRRARADRSRADRRRCARAAC